MSCLPPSPTTARAEPAAGAAARRARQAALIARALAYVDAHLDQPLDADRLADCAAMSRFHFHRVFQAHVGCSVGRYVTWRRLRRACALLASGREAVLEIALAVGFESAQALAKALKRELDTTPTAVRRGADAAWPSLPVPRLPPAGIALSHGEPQPMQPSRFATVPDATVALTATGRGMIDHHLTRAAQQAFGELGAALGRSGRQSEVRSWISLMPDDPQGPDDPHCRYIAGVVFGHALADGRGECRQPDLPLTGTLAWQPIAPGRCAVFTHRGPYDGLHRSWGAIYRDWLPASGETLRDAWPMELCLNSPERTPPADLLTELWVPIG